MLVLSVFLVIAFFILGVTATRFSTALFLLLSPLSLCFLCAYLHHQSLRQRRNKMGDSRFPGITRPMKEEDLTLSCSTRAYFSCLACVFDSTKKHIGSSIVCRMVSIRLLPLSRIGHSRSPVLCQHLHLSCRNLLPVLSYLWPYALHLQHCMTFTSLPSGMNRPLVGAFLRNSRAAWFSGKSGIASSGRSSASSWSSPSR